MNCIIIEDQPPAQRILKKYMEELGSLRLIGIFPDALKAIDFLKSSHIDLIFLDIHLPKISGIDFLKSLTNPPQVILTTAFPDYALESYELNVVDYLLKPFSFQRFVMAVAKVVDKKHASQNANLTNSENKEIFIKSGFDFIKIAIQEINYLRSDADYTEIHLAEKRVLSSEPLRYWIEILPNNQFVRIHKSYIVNISSILRVSGNRVFLNNNTHLPIGRVYKDSFMSRFLHK